MTTIYHLTVGDTDFVPTPKQLQDIVTEFQKPMPTFTVPVKVTELQVEPSTERLMLHVGDTDWTPTEDELASLRGMFNVALHGDPNGAVVATRPGVAATVIPEFHIQSGESK